MVTLLTEGFFNEACLDYLCYQHLLIGYSVLAGPYAYPTCLVGGFNWTDFFIGVWSINLLVEHLLMVLNF